VISKQWHWKRLLGATDHEIETTHEKHHVDEQQPVALEGDFALGDEGLPDISTRLANTLTLDKGVCLWQTETKGDDEHWRTGAEPV